jgi:hypothetical protein
MRQEIHRPAHRKPRFSGFSLEPWPPLIVCNLAQNVPLPIRCANLDLKEGVPLVLVPEFLK